MNFLVIVVILFGLSIIPGIINSILALKCPECKKYFALVWQEDQQRDICKHCSWFVYAKDFVPPKVSYHRWMQNYSPITYKKKEKKCKK